MNANNERHVSCALRRHNNKPVVVDWERESVAEIYVDVLVDDVVLKLFLKSVFTRLRNKI
jgi:hypothetical protein